MTQGAWTKTASKTYRHVSGITVRYRHNAWTWEIVGGPADGQQYGTLKVAAYVVETGQDG